MSVAAHQALPEVYDEGQFASHSLRRRFHPDCFFGNPDCFFGNHEYLCGLLSLFFEAGDRGIEDGHW